MQITKIHFEDKILNFQMRLRGWDTALGVFNVFFTVNTFTFIFNSRMP